MSANTTRRTWSAQDDKTLRATYSSHTIQAIATLLGTTKHAVRNRARKLGLRKPSRFWTSEERDAVLRLYASHSAAELAVIVGKPLGSIYDMAGRLGLRKSTDWIADRARERAREPNNPMHKTRFQPGHKTWNAGMKGLRFSPATEFKPGNTPHTWRPIGHTRQTKDGYLERKIADTGTTRRDFAPLHHLIWRMHGGSIPRGYALTFRDGNIHNLDVNNLELITRAELMRRNSVHRYPAPIVQAVRAKAVLVRKINQLINHQATQEATA